MDQTGRQRGMMAVTGAVAGLALWLVFEVIGRGHLGERAALFLATLTGLFFAATLAMTGPLRLRQAALGAGGVALAVAGLVTLASFRHAHVSEFLDDPVVSLAGAALAFLPLPFWVAAWQARARGEAGGDAGGLRAALADYPALFSESWGMVMRSAAAWVFTGLVWAVIWLSDALLGIVGLGLMDLVLDLDPVPWLITGGVLGLALAVVTEMDFLSPQLLLRLLRLLVVPVLAVMAVFLLALPLRGLSGLFGDVSVALTLLAMAGAAATLVSSAVDQGDAEAVASPLIRRATQGLALLLPLPAAVAAYVIWLRVDQYGWTPDRVFAATAAAVALGYGLSYAAAVLRGAGWMARVRRANVAMAVLLATVAGLWLTPVLNAERIAAASQVARYEDGRGSLANLDLIAIDRWGRAGEAARARLAALAEAPGGEALAQKLADYPQGAGGPLQADDTARVLADLVALMPLQPAGATATRDMLLAAIPAEELRGWLEACRAPLADGRPGCVFVVADLWADQPGEEAIVLLRDLGGYVRYEGLGMVDGMVQRRAVLAVSGQMPDLVAGAALIAQFQDAPPPVAIAPLNQIGAGAAGLVLMP